MKSSKRIISFILAFAMGFSLLALPAAADYISSETFGSWVSRNSPEFIQQWTHGFFGAGCTVSEDGRHHATSFQTDLGTGYYDCICSDCGHAFRAYYQDSYDQSVSELPATTINSDGSFWIPAHWVPQFWQIGNKSEDTAGLYTNVLIDGNYLSFDTYPYKSSNSVFLLNCFFAFPDCDLPAGTYTFYSPEITVVQVPFRWTCTDKYCVPLAFKDIYGGYFDLSDNSPRHGQIDFSRNYDRTFHIVLRYDKGNQSYGTSYSSTYNVYADLEHILLYVPDTPYNVSSGDTYNIDNRVGSLVGNYTYEGDNGTQIIAEDIRIVNETDQSVYNPVTNETYYYNEYTYNYGDRSYDFSFGDRDDHVSVTYGDDCVTIEDGDHTYTIYYTTASNHEHSYRITNIIDPTCTEQGKIYKSCSECGDELIEFTDALGHDWQITEQTAVDYVLPEARCPACESQYFTYELVDEVFYCVCQDCGEEWNCNADVMEGHMTYTCSRCGEERTETNQEQDLSLFEAIGALLADTFEWITDKLGQFINSLSGLSERFSSRIESIIESVGNYPLLFGAFLAGMPDDLMNIVWFGVIALVFVLVWKKFFS